MLCFSPLDCILFYSKAFSSWTNTFNWKPLYINTNIWWITGFFFLSTSSYRTRRALELKPQTGSRRSRLSTASCSASSNHKRLSAAAAITWPAVAVFLMLSSHPAREKSIRSLGTRQINEHGDTRHMSHTVLLSYMQISALDFSVSRGFSTEPLSSYDWLILSLFTSRPAPYWPWGKTRPSSRRSNSTEQACSRGFLLRSRENSSDFDSVGLS